MKHYKIARKEVLMKVGLFVFDGLTLHNNAVEKVFSSSMQEKCTLHFQRNLNIHINPNEPFYTPLEASNKLNDDLTK